MPFPEDTEPIIITETIFQRIERHLGETKLTGGDYVFRSRKGSGPLTSTSVSHLVKKWYEAAQIEGSSGVRSLRKMSQGRYPTKAGASPELFEEIRYEETLKPIQTETLREVVFNQLLQAIILGKIRPGERILARRIAETMNVSLMPVRDALGRLEAGGFISWTHKRAFIVNTLSRENLNEIFQIRMALESLGAEAAWRNRSKEMVEKLERSCELIASSSRRQDMEENTRLNMEFHKMLFQNVDMPILKQILDNLSVRVSPYYYITLLRGREGFDFGQPAKAHEKIVAALKKGSLAEFRNALKEDNLNGIALINRALERLE